MLKTAEAFVKDLQSKFPDELSKCQLHVALMYHFVNLGPEIFEACHAKTGLNISVFTQKGWADGGM